MPTKNETIAGLAPEWWVAGDGRMFLVRDMETSHIANCIAKIKRSKKGWRREWLERLEREYMKRAIEHHLRSD